MTWVLTRGLVTVRDEFNAVFPHRDKASDGTIGNAAHQASVSGHNPDITGNAEYRDGDNKDEVRAIDIDADLRSTVTMEQVVQYLRRRARAGTYIPFRYMIYNRRIWGRRDGWLEHAYTGDPHTSHLHISGDYTQTADEWTGSLGLATLVNGDDMPLTPAEIGALRKQMDEAIEDYNRRFWTAPTGTGTAIRAELDAIQAQLAQLVQSLGPQQS